MDINTDPGCSRIMDPELVPGSNLDPDVIMALVAITGHPDELGSSGSTALECLTCTQMAAQTLGICSAFDGKRSYGHQGRP